MATMAMDTMAARRGKLKLLLKLTLLLILRLTPGTTMAGLMLMAIMAMVDTTDPMATMAMDTMAARRGKLKLLLKLTLRLTLGTTMAMPGLIAMVTTLATVDTMVDTMATPMPMATMVKKLD